jgi:hypothetical protein
MKYEYMIPSHPHLHPTPTRVPQTGGVRFACLKNRPENRSVNRTARFALVS